MRENFERCVAFVLDHEGGQITYDDGGATRWGIAQKYHPHVDVYALTRDQAKTIYLDEYWTPNGCDTLPWPMDLAVFDTAVNCGADDAVAFLNHTPSLDTYLLRRIAYYDDRVKHSPIKARWFHGWVRRVLDLRALAST